MIVWLLALGLIPWAIRNTVVRRRLQDAIDRDLLATLFSQHAIDRLDHTKESGLVGEFRRHMRAAEDRVWLREREIDRPWWPQELWTTEELRKKYWH